MRAGQLTSPRHMELVEVPEPLIQSGEVLVRIRKASICCSDLRPFAAVLPEEEYPLGPGRPTHECAGVVEESFCQEFSAGQRVIVFPYDMGGLQEYLSVPPSNLVLIPNEGPMDVWVMCQHMGTVLYTVGRMGDVVDKDVVVLGQGSIGLAFTRFLSGMNTRELIVADLEDYRLDMARSLGATCTINPQNDNLIEAVQQITDGRGADIVVEAAGEPETVRQSVLLTKQFGTVIWFGITHNQTFPLDFSLMRDRELTAITTSSARAGFMPRYVEQVVHMITQERLDPSYLITHRMDLEDMQKAHTMFEERSDGIIKVVMDL